jgi:hypothetical protein
VKYAVIVWGTEAEAANGPGQVYRWYPQLATALLVATNLVQSGSCFKAVAVKLL